MATETSAIVPAARRRRLGLGHLLWIVPLAAALLFAAYTAFALSWSYSTGERAGVVQKFSERGWVCKTYEGELAMYVVAGVQPEIWYFSVRDEAVARQLATSVGERVQLHYTEHPPFHRCFGDTGYFVERVTVLRPEGGALATVGAAPLGSAPTPGQAAR